MGIRKLTTLISGVAIACLCFSATAEVTTDKGIVGEIIEHSLTSDIKFPPDFYADITWVIAPGTYVKGPIYDKNGKKIRKGDLLAKCDPRHFEAKVDAAEGDVSAAKGELKDARIDYERQKKLVATKTISEKERDEAEATLFRAMGGYKSAIAELELAKIKLGYCQLEAPYSGFISEVYITKGGWSNIDYPVARLDRLCPLYVNVKIDRETAKKIVTQEVSVALKVKGVDGEIGVYNNRIELSETGLKIPVDNYILPDSKKSDDNKIKIISEVTPVVRFDLRYKDNKDNKELAIWQNCKFSDDKGDYVWKAVGQKTMQPGKTIDKQFKVEKVYVVTEDEFRESISGQMQKLKDPGSLQQYDSLLTKEPTGIKNGDEVAFKPIQPLFWPGDEVEVIIGK
jgi:multidrug efflux pump subunit AcrA (membrane-fusion protein)